MSLGKRHIGRRVAGVGVAVTLMVLGLAAPASAAPVVSALSPTSGPVGCVVSVTGTGFDQPGAFALEFVRFTGADGIDDVEADFFVVSDTELWTTVPVDSTDGPITVTDEDGTAGSSAVFDVTEDEGDCGPTVASFIPTCGVVGTVVTITGTNLLSYSGDTITEADPAGGDVQFNPYNTDANHTGATESPTTLVVNVSGDAVDGPIRVSTEPGAGDNTVDSTESFTVVTDPTECGAVTEGHPRAITLKLKKHLRARGVVSSTEDPAFTECVASVPVKVQRKKKGGGWKNVGSTTTTDTGSYKVKIKDRPGKYRAIAPKVAGATAADDCLRAKSARRTHKH